MKSLATSLFVLAVARFVAACAPREPAPPPPPLPPIPVIAEAPPDAIACSRVHTQLAAGVPKLRARLAFAGCYAPPCPPCPPDVACSPCAMGSCTFVGDTPAEAACELSISGVSAECQQMIPGTVYVTELEGRVGYGFGHDAYGAACRELAGAPRVDLEAAHAARRAALAAHAGKSSSGPPEPKRYEEPGPPEPGRRYAVVFSFFDPGDGRDVEAERRLQDLVRASKHPPRHARGRWGASGEHDECFDEGEAFMEWMQFVARASDALRDRPKVRRSLDAPCRNDAR